MTTRTEQMRPWVDGFFRGRNYHLRIRARAEFNKAKREGRITPRPCEVCGVASAMGHHEDYAEPLSVRWLCHRHHSSRHRAPEDWDEDGNLLSSMRDSGRTSPVTRCPDSRNRKPLRLAA